MSPQPSTPHAALLTCLLLGLAACAPGLGARPTPTPEATSTPSPTPVPLAVTVNGQGVPQAEFEAEVARYQQAMTSLGTPVEAQAAFQAVLEDLIDSLLLAQGAAREGYVVDEAALQARLDGLAAGIGGAQALADWETTHGYTDETFRSALRRQMAAAWMRDRIAATVPLTADQVHVRQILLYNEEEAQSTHAQLLSGVDFDLLAAASDPLTHGELGWFPQGTLAEAALEAAAFGLQPGQFSAVIQTGIGYHILLLVERDPARPLTVDLQLTLQEQAVQDWLDQQRTIGTILIAP